MHRTGLPRSGMRVVAAALLLTFLIGGGTTGYLLLENWTLSESIYMTIITLTTVGFGEVRPLSAAGQHFTIVFLVVSVATVGFSISTVISYLFEGQIIYQSSLFIYADFQFIIQFMETIS